VELEVLMKQLKLKTGNTIDPSIRSFALTLNFYSPMADKYVREVFNKSLPHPSTLRKWYATVDGAPGFTAETLNAVKMKVNELNVKGKKLVCGLIMDEMYIKEATHFNGQRLQGYVNYGLGADNHDGLLKATEALVFMLVALNSYWKITVGYFLIKGIGLQDKATLVNTCLKTVHDTGVIVRTFTFDGTTTNITMANKLGANIFSENAVKFFPYPVTNKSVHIFLDPAHMLKLCRNTLGD
jgi:hypothetical protein